MGERIFRRGVRGGRALRLLFLAASALPASLGHAEPPAVATESPAPPPAEAEPADVIELTFAGDIIFGQYGDTRYYSHRRPEDHPLEEVAPLLRSDLAVANLETPLLDELPPLSPITAQFRFGATADRVPLLTKAGIGAVSLANNHAYDLALPGVLQTPIILRRYGVTPLGASRAAAEGPSGRVETVLVRGVRVGFLSWATRRNIGQRSGEPLLPYSSTGSMAERLGPVLQEARAQHDLLVVLLHWGNQYTDEPTSDQVRAAHRLIDAGADLVVGHHPHVLQGIERYKKGVIAYSLGNFLLPHLGEIPRQTGVLRVRFQRSERCMARVALQPAYMHYVPRSYAVPAPAGSKTRIGRTVRERIQTLSQRLNTLFRAEGEDLILSPSSCQTGAPPQAPAATSVQANLR